MSAGEAGPVMPQQAATIRSKPQQAASLRGLLRLVAPCTATKASYSNACCALYCGSDSHSNLLTIASLLHCHCFTSGLLLLFYWFTTMQVSELVRQASNPHSLLRNSAHAQRIRKARVVFAGTLTGLAISSLSDSIANSSLSDSIAGKQLSV